MHDHPLQIIALISTDLIFALIWSAAPQFERTHVMDPKLNHLVLVAANDLGFEPQNLPAKRRAFCIEIDRRGMFLSLGGRDAYVCAEPHSAWSFVREPGGFDTQMWRLHLIVSRAPR
jgi:hypothetical protein